MARAQAVSRLPLLVRTDSGFDSSAIFAALATARAAGSLDWLVKWNPRTFAKAALHQRLAADGSTVWTSPCEGKRETLLEEAITREHGGVSVAMRRVIHLIKRTIDRHGQILLMPDIEIEGWLTSLTLPMEEIVKLYQGHGTHEQFHSELFGFAESFASLRTTTTWHPAG